MTVYRLLALGLLAPLLLAGCGDNRAKQLDTTLQSYEATIRWGDFQRAMAFIHPDERPEPRQLNFMMQRLEQIRVTSYRGVSTGPGPEPDTVINIAELRIANRHTAHERTVNDRQVWRYDEEGKRWWLISGLPDLARRGAR